MTYKQQMQKAIKGYMKDIGFKYDAQQFTFYKDVDEDCELALIYAATSHGFKEYYDLNIQVSVIRKSWNLLLYELTNNKIDMVNFRIGMFSFPCPPLSKQPYSMTFSSHRSIDDNLLEFKSIIQNYALIFWELFSDDVTAYNKMFSEEYSYVCQFSYRFSYPVACYMHKDYDRALEYAKSFLSEHKQEVKAKPNIEGLRKQLELYTTFYNNLRKLIKNQPDYRPESVLDRIKNLTMVLQ